MRILAALTLMMSIPTARADCKKPISFVRESSNWRLVNALYKPKGEHTGKPVVVTLPRGETRSITFFDAKLGRERNIPFFSSGDVGDAFRETKHTPEALRRMYRTLLIRIKNRSGACRWLKVNPLRRSDGK